MCAFEWRYIVEGIRNKSKIVKYVTLLSQGRTDESDVLLS